MIDAIVESGNLVVQMSLMGDPFNEDPAILLQKYKYLWAIVKREMPEILHRSRIKSTSVIGAKDHFGLACRNRMADLVEEAGLPSMMDLLDAHETGRVFTTISEILGEDIIDFLALEFYGVDHPWRRPASTWPIVGRSGYEGTP